MRRRLISACVVVMMMGVGAEASFAQTIETTAVPANARPFMKLRFDIPVEPVSPTWTAVEPAPETAQRKMAFVYSDGYRTRAKIHRIASYATLPLFVAEGIVGRSLYNNPTDGKKSLHLGIATAMGGLFAVNSVTGVWNLLEARKDPNGKTRRTLHGILMLAADAGFLATAMTGPSNERFEVGGQNDGGSRSQHRALAFTSIGLATASYLIMLFHR